MDSPLALSVHEVNVSKGIKAAIHDDIRPLIMQDGGDIEFVAFENGVVTIKFSGACVSCPFSMMTLKLGILERLSDTFPDVKDVIAL